MKPLKKILQLKLYWQILIAMILGTICGIMFQSAYNGKPSGVLYTSIITLGTIFIRLLKMTIVPLVFISITSGVASVGSGKALGRLTVKSFTFYIVSTLIAIFIGLALANILKPGVGSHIPVSGNFNKDMVGPATSPLDMIINVVPENPMKAMLDFDMIGIIFFSIILGYGISKVGPEVGKPLQRLFDSSLDVMMVITGGIIKLAPVGVLGLITKAVSTAGVMLYKELGLYMFTVSAGLTIQMFIVLPIIIYMFTGYHPWLHFKAMFPAIVTAFTTCSSNATLSVAMQCVEKNAGVSNRVCGFVMPLGATVNSNGTALYECAGVIFISQVLGMGLTITQQVVLVLSALAAALGCAGIPSAGIVLIFVVTQAVGFKSADVSLIIGAMLAVDRPLDMFRTTLNVFGDTVGAVVVAKSEGEKNLYPGLNAVGDQARGAGAPFVEP